MKYELFSRLYNEAMDYEDVDMYIAERGWQEWMDEYADGNDASDIAAILTRIYDLANMDIKAMRAQDGLSFKKFSAVYGIPERTIQDWEYGKRRTPEYVRRLLAYTMLEK